MSGQKLTPGATAEMAEEYEERKERKPLKVVMVIFGYIYPAPAHMVVAQSYECKLENKHTQSDVESAVIETEAFIRSVLEK